MKKPKSNRQSDCIMLRHIFQMQLFCAANAPKSRSAKICLFTDLSRFRLNQAKMDKRLLNAVVFEGIGNIIRDILHVV